MSIMRLSAFVLAFATALGATPSRADTNGWVFVTEPDPGSRLVRIRAVVRTGGVADPENLPGLAYFTGRALLRGTRTRRYNELVSAIERAGASLSVEAEEDRTVFSAEVLAGNLDAFLDIFRDVPGLENKFEECWNQGREGKTASGITFKGLSDYHMLECQLALKPRDQKPDRIKILQDALENN